MGGTGLLAGLDDWDSEWLIRQGGEKLSIFNCQL
jgi:hypothetical protein